MTKKITAYEVVDHGIDHCQYFPGCSAVFTEYADCAVGAGCNPAEALSEALEMLANDYDANSNADLNEEMAEAEREFGARDLIAEYCGEDYDGECELYYYVSIRVR